MFLMLFFVWLGSIVQAQNPLKEETFLSNRLEGASLRIPAMPAVVSLQEKITVEEAASREILKGCLELFPKGSVRMPVRLKFTDSKNFAFPVFRSAINAGGQPVADFIEIRLDKNLLRRMESELDAFYGKDFFKNPQKKAERLAFLMIPRAAAELASVQMELQAASPDLMDKAARAKEVSSFRTRLLQNEAAFMDRRFQILPAEVEYWRFRFEGGHPLQRTDKEISAALKAGLDQKTNLAGWIAQAPRAFCESLSSVDQRSELEIMEWQMEKIGTAAAGANVEISKDAVRQWIENRLPEEMFQTLKDNAARAAEVALAIGAFEPQEPGPMTKLFSSHALSGLVRNEVKTTFGQKVARKIIDYSVARMREDDDLLVVMIPIEAKPAYGAIKAAGILATRKFSEKALEEAFADAMLRAAPDYFQSGKTVKGNAALDWAIEAAGLEPSPDLEKRMAEPHLMKAESAAAEGKRENLQKHLAEADKISKKYGLKNTPRIEALRKKLAALSSKR